MPVYELEILEPDGGVTRHEYLSVNGGITVRRSRR
jgi:hypothetical protein